MKKKNKNKSMDKGIKMTRLITRIKKDKYMNKNKNKNKSKNKNKRSY